MYDAGAVASAAPSIEATGDNASLASAWPNNAHTTTTATTPSRRRGIDKFLLGPLRPTNEPTTEGVATAGRLPSPIGGPQD